MVIVVYNDHKSKTPTSTRKMYKKGFKHWKDRGLLQASVLFNLFAIVRFIYRCIGKMQLEDQLLPHLNTWEGGVETPLIPL